MKKLYYSPDLFDLLSSMDSNVARFLISLDDTFVTKQTHGIDLDMTLMDIDKQNLGYLKFTSSNKLKSLDLTKEVAIYTYFKEHSIWIESRNSIKIGKFIQKFNTFSNKEIEDFVNLFKASINIPNETIELVSGEDIRYWYLKSNYYSDNGTLGSSCMRHDSSQKFLDIYVKNPDTCKLLIIKRNNKLVARALVWKIKKVKVKSFLDYDDDFRFSPKNLSKIIYTNKMLSNKEFIMDKCYYITDHYHTMMKNYAKKNNWIFTKSEYSYYVYDDNNKKYNKFNLKIQLKVTPMEFEKYPYMDTFSRYNSKKGILYNDNDSSKIGHILRSTYGEHRESKTRWEYIKYLIGW